MVRPLRKVTIIALVRELPVRTGAAGDRRWSDQARPAAAELTGSRRAGPRAPGGGIAEQGRERERAARRVGDAPQSAVGGGAGLVLPGMSLRRAASAGVQVVAEQGRHERLGGGGLEHLDA